MDRLWQEGEKDKVWQTARMLQAALVDCGCCYENKQLGVVRPVDFNSITVSGHWLMAEIDVMNLPAKTTVAKMISKPTMHHVRTLAGRPVKFLNTVGLTYCVDMREPHERRRVALPQLVDLDQSFAPDPFWIGLGVSREGHVWVNPENLRNWLVAGSQGSGKSAFLRLLAYQMTLAGWKLALADADLMTFNPDLWKGAKCLIGGHVASSEDEVFALLHLVIKEIERRKVLFGNAPGYPDDLTSYNLVADEPLPRIGLLVDEANTYFDSRPLLNLAADISRRARKWGFHTVFVGHNWRSTDIPRRLSAMLQSRLCFRVEDDTSGQVTLERSGMGESLPANVPGRGWSRIGGKYQLLQTYNLERARLVELVKQLPRTDVAPVVCAPKPVVIETKRKLTKAQRAARFIVLAAKKGKNNTWIQRAVWGGVSGPRAKQVKAILTTAGVSLT
jgi:hypothetical protein